MARVLALVAALFTLVSIPGPATPALAAKNVTPTGVWRSPGGNTRIRIVKCGQKICGKVYWASERAKADAARAGHPDLIGMQLFEDFRRTGPNTFEGRVFVPDMNRRFNGRMTVVDPTEIVVRGCLRGNVGCRNQTWTRYTG